tara:strand:+ start:560 stop:991 length:432 start_codon:yes stop_codon:yes gene_type:complete
MQKLVLTALLLFIPPISLGCSCPSSSLTQLYEGADDVFVVSVTAVTFEATIEQQRGIYDVMEILKGGTTGYGNLLAKTNFFVYGQERELRSQCGPGSIISGATYVVFASEGERLEVDGCEQRVKFVNQKTLIELRKLQLELDA